MHEKKLGYLLLGIGLTIIGFSFVSLILVFTNKVQPAQVFHFESVALDPAAFTPQMPDLSAVPGMDRMQYQQTEPPKKVELLSADNINRSSNVIAHLMLMGFLLNVGAKIANIGTNLIRPIVVKTSQETLQPETS